jgi:hypothetical protein
MKSPEECASESEYVAQWERTYIGLFPAAGTYYRRIMEEQRVQKLEKSGGIEEHE